MSALGDSEARRQVKPRSIATLVAARVDCVP